MGLIVRKPFLARLFRRSEQGAASLKIADHGSVTGRSAVWHDRSPALVLRATGTSGVNTGVAYAQDETEHLVVVVHGFSLPETVRPFSSFTVSAAAASTA
jgi:hypothetical protein